MNLARVESLSLRDQRVFNAAFNAITRALLPRRFVPLNERSEAAYMVLAAIHAELPPALHRRPLLRAGRLSLHAEPGTLAAGLRVKRDAVILLLPLVSVRWER